MAGRRETASPGRRGGPPHPNRPAAQRPPAGRRGPRRIQIGVTEPDVAGHRLLAALGYRPVRVFRELRIDVDAAPEQPQWPDGLLLEEFDADRDATAFHAAHQEAFGDLWEYRPRDISRWRELHIETDSFDPSLWRIVRAGEEVAG